MYAIVDIETTGGHASANGITEVAICIHDGQRVTERYSTLVNPGSAIPVYIRALTGISDEMVKDAPPFDKVAGQIYALLEGKVFVAHHVNFDYSFLRYHLAAAGYQLDCPRLCTVRLGRKILPGLSSYSLGKLCHSLGISNTARHRAGGDAEATAQLFSLLLQKDDGNHIRNALKQRSSEQQLPANLPMDEFNALPFAPGVYYFHDEKGRVIYVGKARNIKNRVRSHFTGNNAGRQRQEFLRHIHHISYQDCGTELMALVLEATEIRRLWPRYNRALKRFEQQYGLYAFEDQRGYLRLAVDKKRRFSTPVYACQSQLDGRALLSGLVRDFGLCPKLCFLRSSIEPCGPDCACSGAGDPAGYNGKVLRAINAMKESLPTFAIRDQGRHGEEHSWILVESGRFYGMGYSPAGFSAESPAQLRPLLQPGTDMDYIRNIIAAFALRHPEKTRHFNAAPAQTG